MGVMAYLLWASLGYELEWRSLDHFRVPSRAEIDALSDRKARVRAEAQRQRALDERGGWLPYGAWSVANVTLSLAATLGALIFGALATWRGVKHRGVGGLKLAVVGVLLLSALVSLAFLAPPQMAERAYEKRQTHFAQAG
jgi:hypothetical protein